MTGHEKPCTTEPRRTTITRLIAADGHDVILGLAAEFGKDLRKHMSPGAAATVEAVEAACGMPLLVECLETALRDQELVIGTWMLHQRKMRRLNQFKVECAKQHYQRCIRDAKLIWDTAPFDKSSQVLAYKTIMNVVYARFGENLATKSKRRFASKPKQEWTASTLAFATRWCGAIDGYLARYDQQLVDAATALGEQHAAPDRTSLDEVEPTACARTADEDLELPPVNVSTDAPVVRRRLTHAFAILRKRGYFARGNWTCCQNCGWEAVPKRYDRLVFWHQQQDEHLRQTGECWLTWCGDGQEIADVMRAAGLAVEWDGTVDMRICVSLANDEVRMRAPTTVDSPTERPADADQGGQASPRNCAAPGDAP